MPSLPSPDFDDCPLFPPVARMRVAGWWHFWRRFTAARWAAWEPE